MNEKPVIKQIGDIRIVRDNAQNVAIERFETRKGFQRKGEIQSWSFVGFYSDVFAALRAIHMKGLLINENSISDIKNLVKQLEESEKRVLQAIREVSS